MGCINSDLRNEAVSIVEMIESQSMCGLPVTLARLRGICEIDVGLATPQPSTKYTSNNPHTVISKQERIRYFGGRGDLRVSVSRAVLAELKKRGK